MVMFGRESIYQDLHSTIENITPTLREDLELEEAIFAEFQLTMDSDNLEIEDVFLTSLNKASGGRKVTTGQS